MKMHKEYITDGQSIIYRKFTSLFDAKKSVNQITVKCNKPAIHCIAKCDIANS